MGWGLAEVRLQCHRGSKTQATAAAVRVLQPGCRYCGTPIAPRMVTGRGLAAVAPNPLYPPPCADVHRGGDPILPPCAGMHMGGERSLHPVLNAQGGWLYPPPCANVHGGPRRVAARSPYPPPPLDGAGGGPSAPPPTLRAQGTAVWPPPRPRPAWADRARTIRTWPANVQSCWEAILRPQAACEPQDRPSNQIKSNPIPLGGGCEIQVCAPQMAFSLYKM